MTNASGGSTERVVPLFVMLAPLAPLLGAVVAFQTEIDPAGQLASATPLASGRLPFLRAMLSCGAALVAVAGLYRNFTAYDLVDYVAVLEEITDNCGTTMSSTPPR